MKKLLLLIGLICCFGSASAQTKTAYCDVYMRGGYDCMTVTIMFDSNSHRLNRSYSMGEILNIMAEDGWVLDNDIVIPRHPFYSFFTRHKLHLIMKKEYNKGEDPFAFVKLFCQKKAHIDEVKEDTERVVMTADSTTTVAVQESYETIVSKADNAKVGYTFEYNGVNAIVIKIIGDQYIIAATGSIYGTWDEAMAYCQTLGSEWRLPSPTEFSIINSQLLDNRYWTIEEVDNDKAKFYNWSFDKAYISDKSKSLYILPIAIVDAKGIDTL